jgi:hypothetical protein
MAVGFPTKVSYVDGDVFSASDINDTNGTINLLTSSTLSRSAGKNAVINGGMDVWVRGTSFSIAASTNYGSTTFSADRWQTKTNANQAITISRQATGDTTNLPNIEYCMRYQRNSGQTGTGALILVNNFETANTIPYVGKAVTISFYARKGADYSAASSVLTFAVTSGTGADQNAFAYSGANNFISSSATLTTTWQRFTATGTVPTTALSIAPNFTFTPVGTASTDDYFEITGVQLELGNTPTTFSRVGGNYGLELAACQRYYFRSAAGTSNNSRLGQGPAFSATQSYPLVTFPVTMRVQPSVLDYSNLAVYDGVNVLAVTAATISDASLQGCTLQTTMAGGTSTRFYSLITNNSSSGFIAFSSEL